MRIAVASGKGGTGKTTLATNLASIAAALHDSVSYLDCDVEGPNGHLFLKPKISRKVPAGKRIPVVDVSRCIFCDKCEHLCRFNAIICLDKEVLVYPELCHSCGGCRLICPVDAITESFRETGRIEIGSAGSLRFAQGILNVGEPLSPPLIQAVKETIFRTDIEFIDAPPGTSCPVVESVRTADFVILVTEPTPFGLNDLRLAVNMVRMLKIPFGVVINRARSGSDRVQRFCRKERIEVLAEIPDDRKIAEAYCRGDLICRVFPEYRSTFRSLLERVLQIALSAESERSEVG